MISLRRAAVLFVLAAPLSAQANAKVKSAAETIVAADLMRDISYIASDELKGRATPSPGLDSAAAYIIRRLTELHVKPVGDNGGYLQYYTVVRATLDTALTSITFAGQHLTWGNDFVIPSFLTPGVREGKVVYVGAGLRVPKRGIDPYAGLDLKGKWVLVHASQIRPRSVTTDSLGVVGLDYTTVLDEARARGALGILLIPSAANLAAWNTNRARVPTGRDLDPTVGRAYAPYPLPQVTLSPAAVLRLFEGETVQGADVLAADSLHRYPRSLQLGSAKAIKVDFSATVAQVRAFNVVGLVEGSDSKLKNEWITVSTHLDGAVGRAITPSGDSIYNAADDNGTGSAGNLSIARALMTGPRPRRSILLVWDSGEETGLWGSRFLAYGPLAKKVVAHFTVDMIGRTKVPGTDIQGQAELSGPGEVFVSGPAVLSTVLDSGLARVSRDYNYIHFDRRFEDPKHEFFYPRTDAAPYIENGIPYVEFFTGLHEDYHRQTDEVSKLDPVKFEAVARTVYVTVWTVADGKDRPRIDKPVPPVLWFMRPR
jgi:hypothetical protein